jgi:hypothetical protein
MLKLDGIQVHVVSSVLGDLAKYCYYPVNAKIKETVNKWRIFPEVLCWDVKFNIYLYLMLDVDIQVISKSKAIPVTSRGSL